MGTTLEKLVLKAETQLKGVAEANRLLSSLAFNLDRVSRTGRSLARQQVLNNKLMSGGAQQLINNVSVAQSLANKYDSLAGSLSMSQESWVRVNREGAQFNSVGGRLGNTVRRLTVGMHGFRMEMLSVMFFGMAIQGFFMGLLQPALQAAGIFDIWGMTLQVLFLPVALMLLPWVLRLTEFLLNLDPTTQKIIGIFVLLGVVIGSLLFFIGMVTLGLGGLTTAFGPVLAAIGGILSIGFLPLLAVIAAVIAIVAILAFAWRNNLGNMHDWAKVLWEGVKTSFSGIINVWKGLFNIIAGLFSGDGQRILDGLQQLLTGLFQVTVGTLILIGGALVGWIATLIADAGVAAFDFGKKLVGKIVDGIKAFGGMIKDAISEFIPDSVKNLFSAVSGTVTAAGDLVGLASGGIVTGPTPAIVGEAGPEAVIPLDQLGGLGGTTVNVSVNAAVNNSVDLNLLAKQIGDEVSRSMERSLRR